MTSAIVEAALEFAKDEGRRQRKRFNDHKATALEIDLTALTGDLPRGRFHPHSSAARGEVAVSLFDLEVPFDEAATEVITDILWAMQARGLDPRKALAEASEYFHEEAAGRFVSPAVPAPAAE